MSDAFAVPLWIMCRVRCMHSGSGQCEYEGVVLWPLCREVHGFDCWRLVTDVATTVRSGLQDSSDDVIGKNDDLFRKMESLQGAGRDRGSPH